MASILKKENLEYGVAVVLAIFAGFLVSVYSLSVVFLIASVLFVIISFKYFDQALLFLVLYVPFQVALNVSPGIDLASGRVLILYLFLVWIIKSLAEKRFIIRFNFQTIFLCAFLVLSFFSIFQAWDTERAFRKILVFISIFPVYFIISSFGGRKHIVKFLKALLFGGALISLIGIIQFLSQFLVGVGPVTDFYSKYISGIFYGNTFGAEVVSNPSWLVNISGATVFRAISLFPDPHMLSFYLGLLIPIVFSTILLGNNSVFMRNEKIIYLLLFFMITAEALTFSRGGYIGMIVGTGVLIMLSWKYLDMAKKLLLGFFFSAFIIVAMFSNQSIVSRFLSSFDLQEGSNAQRIKNWQQGWEVFSDNTFWGVGIGNYSIYLYPAIEYREPVYAHNLYLDIGAEMGIFALLAWLLLILITVWQLYKLSRRTKNSFYRALAIGFAGSLVWFSVHSFFDTPIYSPAVLSILLCIISLSVLVIIGEKNKKYVF